MEKRLIQHIAIALSDLKDSSGKEYLSNQIELLKNSYFGENENGRNVVLRRIKPSLTQVIDEIDKNGNIFKEILTQIQNQDQEKYRAITAAIDNLPKSLKDSIYTLAHRAQSRVEMVETDINQLRQEIELWFDRSMERTSGVYKRNAKGVAFLIGLFIAFAVNADTFHIASRLSIDTTVRNAIIQSANQVTSKCTSSQPDCISNEISQSLNTASLPIGWSHANLEQQQKREFKFKERRIPFLVQISGWMLTGIAIAMGAPFWFELLGKFVNVRKAGSKPSSLTDEPVTTEVRKDSVSYR